MAVFSSRITALFAQATDIDLVKVIHERVVRLVDEIISTRVIQEGLFTSDVSYRQFASIAAYLDDYDYVHIRRLQLTDSDLAKLACSPRVQWLRDIASAELQLTMSMDLRDFDQAMSHLESIVVRYIPTISEDLEKRCLQLLLQISKKEIWVDMPRELMEELEEESAHRRATVIRFPHEGRRGKKF